MVCVAFPMKNYVTNAAVSVEWPTIGIAGSQASVAGRTHEIAVAYASARNIPVDRAGNLNLFLWNVPGCEPSNACKEFGAVSRGLALE